jgi:hypothetical protein
MILQWSSWSFGTTRWSLNHRTPSASYQKHWASPNSILRWMWPIPMSVLWAVMMSSLIVGMGAMLLNLPCETTRILSSSGSQQEVWGQMVRCCIGSYSLERLQLHFPFQDDNGLPTHNFWLTLAVFIASYSSQAEWIGISESCDPCRCVLDYPRDSAFQTFNAWTTTKRSRSWVG